MPELWELTLCEIQDEISARRASPAEINAAVRRRIEGVDTDLNAFTAIADQTTAIPGAGTPDDSPLYGVPIAIKELIAVKGLPYTGQSLTRAGVVAGKDASIVSLLRRLGASVVGTTRTHELAFGITTQHEVLGGTKNPWNIAYTPGGSSGGSAVAVAAGMVPLAIGSDTACSVRLPAALCGICGFRPTKGSLPDDGIIPLAPSADTAGLLAREVNDILTAWRGLKPTDRRSEADIHIADLRIGVMGFEQSDVIGSIQRSIYENCVKELDTQVVEVDWPHGMDVVHTYGQITGVETLYVHKNVLDSWPSRADLYGSDVRTRMLALEERGASGLIQAQEAATAYKRRWMQALENADVVLLPASGGGASLVKDPDTVLVDGASIGFRDAVFPWQVSISLLGVPSCVIPAGVDGAGIPIGIQVIGRKHDDDRTLQIAAHIRELLRSSIPTRPM